MLVFGCKDTLFKMDSCGSVKHVRLADVFDKIVVGGTKKQEASAKLDPHEAARKNPKQKKPKIGVPLKTFDAHKFRHMCILAGCDYLPKTGEGTHIIGMGLAKAAGLLQIHASAQGAVRGMAISQPKFKVPSGYAELITKADATFKHQICYDPASKRLVPLTPFPEDCTTIDCEYLGEVNWQDKAEAFAEGRLNSVTLEAIFPTPLGEHTRRKIKVIVDEMAKKVSSPNSQTWGSHSVIPAVPRHRYRRKDALPSSTPIEKNGQSISSLRREHPEKAGANWGKNKSLAGHSKASAFAGMFAARNNKMRDFKVAATPEKNVDAIKSPRRSPRKKKRHSSSVDVENILSLFDDQDHPSFVENADTDVSVPETPSPLRAPSQAGRTCTSNPFAYSCVPAVKMDLKPFNLMDLPRGTSAEVAIIDSIEGPVTAKEACYMSQSQYDGANKKSLQKRLAGKSNQSCRGIHSRS